MLFKMLGIERSWNLMNDSTEEKIPRPRQVFVTQSRVLAEKVEEYYAKLSKSCAAAQRTAEDSAKMASVSQDSEDDGLLDRDEEELWSGNLPKRFSELKQEHFPLFLTFDQVSPYVFSGQSPTKLPYCSSAGYSRPIYSQLGITPSLWVV